MRILTPVVLVALIVAAGCAKRPETISAAYVSPTTYSGWSCTQLAQEARRVHAAKTQAYNQQRRARSNDVAGVLLIGLPVSSLSGDNVAEQVASLKGHEEALNRMMVQSNCASPVQRTGTNGYWDTL